MSGVSFSTANNREVLRPRSRSRSSCMTWTAWLLLLASLVGNIGQIIYLIEIANRPCPPGWTKFQWTCYYASGSKKKSWEESRQDCQSKAARLVTINSQEEQKFVNTLLPPSTKAWMGLNDMETEGNWIWLDRTTPTTTYWQSGQPNSYGGNQDCVEFIHKSSGQLGEWNDDSCDAKNPWICEELH
ncbi:hypothetical protein CRUP_013303, partial [Coryphaenoides rupestris]